MGNQSKELHGKPQSLAEFKAFFRKSFPKYLIEGPYRRLTKLTLVAIFLMLGIIRYHVSTHLATESYSLEIAKDSVLRSAENLKRIKLLAFVYGISVLIHMVRTAGLFPLVSYTMISWSMTTFKYLFGFLAMQFQSKVFKDLEEILRFPSLVQNSTTFGVWWFVLTPIISLSILFRKPHKDESNFKAFLGFTKWNFSPMLLTVHGLNLPFAFLGHLLEPRELLVLDLYHGLAAAGVYLAFYLSVLDRNQIPLYIILSPRSVMGPATYVTLLTGYWKLFNLINEKTPIAAELFREYLLRQYK